MLRILSFSFHLKIEKIKVFYERLYYQLKMHSFCDNCIATLFNFLININKRNNVFFFINFFMKFYLKKVQIKELELKMEKEKTDIFSRDGKTLRF